jgi:hypothetical protein
MTARRVLQRELGFDLEAKHVVRTVAHYTFLWDTRAQDPVGNGTADVSIVLRIDMDDADVRALQLVSKEYRALEWRDLDQEQDRPLHPALVQGLRDLRATLTWDKLITALRLPQSTAAEKESLLREFCLLKGEAL